MVAYIRFALMITVSTVAMFGMMYLNTYAWDHVFFSETRAWMALYMGAGMAVVMLAFMWGMYSNQTLNVAIGIVGLVVFCGAVWLVRSQQTVDQVDWMKAMIPHHSIAILTSERAKLDDPRVRALAQGIIDTQRREIEEMKALVRELDTAR